MLRSTSQTKPQDAAFEVSYFRLFLLSVPRVMSYSGGHFRRRFLLRVCAARTFAVCVSRSCLKRGGTPHLVALLAICTPSKRVARARDAFPPESCGCSQSERDPESAEGDGSAVRETRAAGASTERSQIEG